MSVLIFILSIGGLGLAQPVAAQSANADTAAVTAVVAGLHAGLRTGDAAAVARLLAADAVMLEAGSVETRAQYLEKHLKPKP
jgi:hypothetical protein